MLHLRRRRRQNVKSCNGHWRRHRPRPSTCHGQIFVLRTIIDDLFNSSLLLFLVIPSLPSFFFVLHVHASTFCTDAPLAHSIHSDPRLFTRDGQDKLDKTISRSLARARRLPDDSTCGGRSARHCPVHYRLLGHFATRTCHVALKSASHPYTFHPSLSGRVA